MFFITFEITEFIPYIPPGNFKISFYDNFLMSLQPLLSWWFFILVFFFIHLNRNICKFLSQKMNQFLKSPAIASADKKLSILSKLLVQSQLLGAFQQSPSSSVKSREVAIGCWCGWLIEWSCSFNLLRKSSTKHHAQRRSREHLNVSNLTSSEKKFSLKYYDTWSSKVNRPVT